MPNFSYRARGRDGREIRGTLQAENEASAVAKIRESYPILLSITPLNEKKSLSGLLSMEIGSKRFKTKTLAILCSQFAITLRSGMPIARAMRMLAGQSGDKRLKRVMEETSEKVASGSTVASALEEYSERFPLTFIETIRAGEQSGTLDRSFERLHRFYEKPYRTTEKIKGALTYPIFVIAIAVVVVIIVMAKVIPTIANVFSDLGGELPLLTRMLIGASNFFAKYWILMLGILFLLYMVFRMWGNTEKGKLRKSEFALKLPLAGTINQMNASAQFANTMSVLLAAGITLDQAVETTARVMDNVLFKKEIQSMKAGIEQGRSLTECLRGCSCIPQTMIDMCSVGEETGELEENLENVADYYANEADYRVQKLLAMLEPTLLVCLAIFAGIIVVSIYLPIFTMYDLM